MAHKASELALFYCREVRTFDGKGTYRKALNTDIAFIDAMGKIVIPANMFPDDFTDQLNFNNGNFSDGLARIKKNGKFGYIDRSAKFVIESQFADASECCMACLRSRFSFVPRQST
jgi:hypothetical protein